MAGVLFCNNTHTGTLPYNDQSWTVDKHSRNNGVPIRRAYYSQTTRREQRRAARGGRQSVSNHEAPLAWLSENLGRGICIWCSGMDADIVVGVES